MLLRTAEAGKIGGLAADVERLEEIVGRVDAQAVAEPLGLRRGVAAVDGLRRRPGRRLLLERQRVKVWLRNSFAEIAKVGV